MPRSGARNVELRGGVRAKTRHAHACHAEICGAVTTLLIEEIQKRNIAVTRETATVLGLGIYSDTGSFSFSSVTQRDFAAAGWLLGRGMDINIISEKTAFSMTKEHIRALNALLESAQTSHINGADVVLAWKDAKIGAMDEGLKADLTGEASKGVNDTPANARRGYIDDIIDPSETRQRVAAAFEMLYTKSVTAPQRRHSSL